MWALIRIHHAQLALPPTPLSPSLVHCVACVCVFVPRVVVIDASDADAGLGRFLNHDDSDEGSNCECIRGAYSYADCEDTHALPPRLHLFTSRDVCAGEELVIDYLGAAEDAPPEERRRSLVERYGFDCTCERCLPA